MIDYKKADLIQNGFELQETQKEEMSSFIYKGRILIYELLIDENNDQVSISGDTRHPFGGDSMYEIYVPCKLVIYKPDNEIDYRNFHFSFYSSNTPSEESRVLTISGRKSDEELVVWPYYKWRNED